VATSRRCFFCADHQMQKRAFNQLPITLGRF
jgi:hypothetical protein